MSLSLDILGGKREIHSINTAKDHENEHDYIFLISLIEKEKKKIFLAEPLLTHNFDVEIMIWSEKNNRNLEITSIHFSLLHRSNNNDVMRY